MPGIYISPPALHGYTAIRFNIVLDRVTINKPVPGCPGQYNTETISGHTTVFIDAQQLKSMARKAARAKSKRCVDGPIVMTFKSHADTPVTATTSGGTRG